MSSNRLFDKYSTRVSSKMRYTNNGRPPSLKVQEESQSNSKNNMKYVVVFEDDDYKCHHGCNSQRFVTKPLIEDMLPKRFSKPIQHMDRQAVRQNSSYQTRRSKSPAVTFDDHTAENEKSPAESQRMDWNNYHRLNIIHDFMDELENTYPALCTSGIIGKSLEGRQLKILKISNSNASNSGIWMDAGIHAREWIGPAVNTYVANYIARNFNSLPESVTNKDWYFLPVMNPDGYEYSHTHDRMWRKNRAWHGGKCVGVDLNRNFSYGYGGKGSSENPTHCFYRGPEAFSEPESAAVRDMISNSGVSFKVYITLHSYGEVIIFPFASKEDLCPDYIRLLQGAARMSKAIYDTNGNTYKVGISKDVMYRASGTSNDWSYGTVGIPYCYLIELRSKKHRFKLPQEEIEETGNEILNCVIALMDLVDKYPLEPAKTPTKQPYYHRYNGSV